VVVEMDDEELYVPDVLASAARYQMLPTKLKLRYQKELEKFTQIADRETDERNRGKCYDGIF
jgi:hypothetical protein